MNRSGSKRRMESSLNQLIARLNSTDEWLHDDQLDGILSYGRDAVPSLELILQEIIKKSTGLERHSPSVNSDWMAPVHALFLLAHLNSESSLDIVIEFLGQPPAELDGWIPDLVSDDLWEVLYLMSGSRLKQLTEFVCNNKANEFTRLAACTALAQIGLNQPMRRNAVVDAFKAILQRKDFDSDFVGLIISEIMDMKDEELQPHMLRAIKTHNVWPGIISEDDILFGFRNKRVRRLYPLSLNERFRMLREYTHFANTSPDSILKKTRQFDLEKFL